MTDLTPYFADHLKTLLEQAQHQKENSSNSDTARHWAIVRTELEKVNGYFQTYLANANKIVEGGSK